MGSDQNLIIALLTLYCPFSYKMNMFGGFNVQIMIMVNSIVLYIQKLLREQIWKCSHHKKGNYVRLRMVSANTMRLIILIHL